LKEGLKKHRIRLDAQDGKTLAWLYEKGCVEAVEQDEDYLLLEIMTDEKQFQTLLTMASSLVLLEE
jgi:streptomycin 6-kinase